MINKSLGFIGGGRITRILLEGLSRAGGLPARVVASDPDEATLMRLKARFPTLEVAPNRNRLAASQEIVILAVHPPVVAAVAAEIQHSLRGDAILISLAPQVTIARLTSCLGGFQRIVRAIPNAPALVNTGLTPTAFAPSLTDADKRSVIELTFCWGCCPQVTEEKLEAYAVLSALGPACLWFQLFELRRLAQSFGLTNQEAQFALERMLLGAVKTMAESSLTPEEVMDLVPVKPLREAEAALLEVYRVQLNAIMRNMQPT